MSYLDLIVRIGISINIIAIAITPVFMLNYYNQHHDTSTIVSYDTGIYVLCSLILIVSNGALATIFIEKYGKD